MIPSSTQTNTPASPPFGDLSKSHVIDQGQTCRHCGTPVKTLVSVFATFNQTCRECGRRDTDLVTWCLVDKRDICHQRMASPEYSFIEQVQQYAELFGIRSEDGYGVREAIHLYNSEQRQQERADYVAHLEWNGRVLEFLLEERSSHPGDDGLVQLAVMAHLNGFALPQFRVAAERGA